MPIQPILQLGDPLLRERSLSVEDPSAREIADRLEGKAVQPLSGDLSSSMSVTVNIAVAREKQFGE